MDQSALPPNREPRTRKWIRAIIPVAAVGLALGTFAVAEAATGSGNDSARDLVERGTLAAETPTTTSTSQPDDNGAPFGGVAGEEERTETFLFDALADGATQTFSAGAAGSVTISRTGATVTIVAVNANPGWVTSVESASGPEVEITFRNGSARIDLEAEIEDGGVRVRVRDRSPAVSVDPAPAPDDNDNSGPGSASSGSGDDGADHDVDDDHSGSGSSGSGNSGSGNSGSGNSGSGNSGSGHSGSDDD